MVDWSEGYVTDVGYTRGYYQELNASLQSFILATTGREAPDVGQPYNKVELGCGYGLSLLIEAAANPHAQFFGVDFMPEHITWAKRTAAAAKIDNVHFLEMSFADLRGSALPDCEYVGMHGVWSWIGDDNRQAILRFLDHRLKSGGVTMVSYNVLPGWSANQALRELMMRKYRSASGPSGVRIAEAIKFAAECRAAGAGIFAANPGLSEHLDKITELPPRYLAHEYFNDAWHLFYQHQVAEAFSTARLSFAGACKPAENFDKFNFKPDVIKMIESVAPLERETLRDTFHNRMFRYDMYCRGIENIGLFGTLDQILRTQYVLSDRTAKIAARVIESSIGQIKLKADIFDPILKRLGAGPAAGQDFMYQPGAKPLSPAEITEALVLLASVNLIAPVLPGQAVETRRQSCKRLNEVLIHRMAKGEDIAFLASPLTGFGHNVSNFFQLFILALGMGKDPVSYTWRALKSVGKRMLKDGKMLESEAENLKELEARYQEFEADFRPLWKHLGIID